MKTIIKTLLITYIVLLSGCVEDEKLPFERITEAADTAGGLRTISLISPSIDLNDITNAEFAVEVEEWDDQDGGLLESVDVFVQFQDFTPDNGDSSVPEQMFKTIPNADFTRNATTNLPRTIIRASAQEAIDLLGLDPTVDIDGGDIFRFRLSLNLSDGSVFSSGNLEGNVTGVFFSSPFSYPANVVCNLDASLFAGNYQMEFVSGTFNAPFGSSNAYADAQVTITANSGTQRVVQNAPYIPAFGPFLGPITFDLVCGKIVVPTQSAPASCSTSIVQQSGTNTATFDPSDDSEFFLIFDDEVTGDCGAPTYEVGSKIHKTLIVKPKCDNLRI